MQFRDKDNAKLLKLTKNVKRVVLVPDQEMNGAGMKGAAETCTFLCKHGVDARILALPHASEKAAAETKAEHVRQRGTPEPEIKTAAEWKVGLN